jgi:hypothetical protein
MKNDENSQLVVMHTSLGNVILLFGNLTLKPIKTCKACKHGFIHAYFFKIGENKTKKLKNALNSSKQRIESLQGSSTLHLDHWVYLLLNDPFIK